MEVVAPRARAVAATFLRRGTERARRTRWVWELAYSVTKAAPIPELGSEGDHQLWFSGLRRESKAWYLAPLITTQRRLPVWSGSFSPSLRLV